MRLLFTILLVIFGKLQFDLWYGDNGYFKYQELNESITKLQEKHQSLIARNEQLQAEVTELQTGTDLLEEKARSEYNFVKEDEVFYHLIKP